MSAASPLHAPGVGIPSGERYRQGMEFLYSRLNYERSPEAAASIQDFRLARMEALLQALGNPHLGVPTVHLAGSKGKGSTAQMVASCAQAAGYRTGLFTSPHLLRYEERLTVNGVEPTESEMADLLDQVRLATARLEADSIGSPTFFELTTAMGWLHFRQQRAELAVVEVGLGGRLDCTNICQPLVTAITSISRDHVRLLGDTEELIAGEKAGIIKPNVPIVSAVTAPGPAGVIADVAARVGAPLFVLGRDFQVVAEPHGPPPYPVPPRYRFAYSESEFALADVLLAMPGEHQTRNAAVAVCLIRRLGEAGFPISVQAMRSGLEQARSALRVELVSRFPIRIVDVAHNPASMTALCDTLGQVSAKRRILVFASSKDKEYGKLLEILSPCFDDLILTRYLKNPRAVGLDELAASAREHATSRWHLAASPEEALALADSLAGPDDLICVTGSFFLAAEAKEILNAKGICASPA